MMIGPAYSRTSAGKEGRKRVMTQRYNINLLRSGGPLPLTFRFSASGPILSHAVIINAIFIMPESDGCLEMRRGELYT